MATTDLGLFGLTPEDYQQAQLEKARANAIEMAKLDPMQRAEAGLRTAGYQLGGGIAGMMGVEDPRLKQISEMQGLLKGIDPTDPTSYFNAAKMSSNPQLAAMLIQRGQAVQKGTLEAAKINAEISAKLSEKMPNEQKLAAAIADTSGAARGTSEWTEKYKKELTRLTTKEGSTSETERLIDSLDLPPEKANELRFRIIEQKIKGSPSEFQKLLNESNLSPEQKQKLTNDRLTALASNDPTGVKNLTAQIAQVTLETKQNKLEQDRKAQKEATNQGINKLLSVEADIDNSLGTAAKALNLAPENFLQASGQALLKNIPWSDAKAINNLVSSLNSDKALATLNELKAQSRTGATGFGALNTKELQLILDKTRALDPTDKMFKDNLAVVINGWQRIRNQAQTSRIDLEEKTPQLQELQKRIAAVRAKGSMSQQEKQEIEALKTELGVK